MDTSRFFGNRQMTRRAFGVGALGAASAGLLTACGSIENGGGAGDAGGGSGNSIRVGGYGGPSEEAFMRAVGAPFQEQSGIEVIMVTYGDQNEMLANVQASPGVYDLVRCSDFGIFDGVNNGLLEVIDTSKVSTFENLAPQYQDLVADPSNEVHNLPFAPAAFVLTSVGDPSLAESEDYSPIYDSANKGQISLRDYAGYRVLQTALSLGFNINEMSAEQEEQVFQRMMEQRELVKTYWTSEAEVRTLISNREILVADYWLENTLMQQEELDITGWVPKEGTPGWVEGYSIPKGGNAELASQLLDFMYQPEVYMELATTSQLIPTLKDDLWDRDEFLDAVPNLAEFIDPIRERSVMLDLGVWDTKATEWSEQYEMMKLS